MTEQPQNGPDLHVDDQNLLTTELLDKVQNLVHEQMTFIPETLAEAEKQEFIGNELVAGLSNQSRLLLRSFIDTCLTEMRRRLASDIDLGGKGGRDRIWLRIQGLKKPAEDFGSFSPDEFSLIIQNLLTDNQRQHLHEHKNLDFSYNFRNREGTTFSNRADAYLDLDSIALNMRAISISIRSYESFNFHTNVTNFMSHQHSKEGLILVTGITGSGKSTTLDAIIDLNNKTVPGHIIIIASPIEFIHSSEKCLIRHREVGRDAKTFRLGVVESLRQDPDIIVIGEMRDPETILAALEVADSGHKVLSTLHTSSAIESIDRIIAEVPSLEQERVRLRLADVLRCVVSQKLIPSTDGKRVLAKEILLMIPSVRAAIRNNNTGEIYQMIHEGYKHGMMTMEQDLKRLINTGEITRETAMNYANNKNLMLRLIQTGNN